MSDPVENAIDAEHSRQEREWNEAMTKQPTDATLLPCPFCGSHDVELRKSITDAMVACNNCGCRTGFIFFGASEAANAAKIGELRTIWNTRTMQAAAPTPNGEGVVTESDFEQIAGLIEHAQQFNPAACYVAAHLFAPLGRIIETARAKATPINSEGLDDPKVLGKAGAALAEALADQEVELSAPQILYATTKTLEAASAALEAVRAGDGR